MATDANALNPMWVEIGLQGLAYLCTVFVMIWRVSAIVKGHQAESKAALMQHELKDVAEFEKLAVLIARTAEGVRGEFGTTVSTLRSHMQESGSAMTERIHSLETTLIRDYMPKDAFYAAIKEFNQQSRDNFNKLEQWLVRIEGRLNKASLDGDSQG